MFKQLDRNLLLLFALNIAFGLTMQLINPLFPLFLEAAGANEVQNAMVISAGNLVATMLMLPSGLLIDRVGKKTLLLLGAGLSPTLIGIFFTAPSIVMMFTQVPACTLAERFGKKRWILSCISLIPFLYLSWIFIENWVVMLITYSLLNGLWSMTWPATLTLLSESVPDGILGAAFGVRMTGVRMGFTVGPLIGSYLYSTYYASSPFLGAAGFAFLAVFVTYILQEHVHES